MGAPDGRVVPVPVKPTLTLEMSRETDDKRTQASKERVGETTISDVSMILGCTQKKAIDEQY